MKRETEKRTYHRFTKEEKRFIRQWYAKTRTICIAHILGLKIEQVKKFAKRHRGDKDDRIWGKNALIRSEINTANRSRRNKT